MNETAKNTPARLGWLPGWRTMTILAFTGVGMAVANLYPGDNVVAAAGAGLFAAAAAAAAVHWAERRQTAAAEAAWSGFDIKISALNTRLARRPRTLPCVCHGPADAADYEAARTRLAELWDEAAKVAPSPLYAAACATVAEQVRSHQRWEQLESEIVTENHRYTEDPAELRKHRLNLMNLWGQAQRLAPAGLYSHACGNAGTGQLTKILEADRAAGGGSDV